MLITDPAFVRCCSVPLLVHWLPRDVGMTVYAILGRLPGQQVQTLADAAMCLASLGAGSIVSCSKAAR